MKVLMTTGGTGGHIYPALALADAMKKSDPENEFLFVGSSDRMEKDIIPAAGYRFIGIEAARFDGPGSKLKAMHRLYRAYKGCLKIVDDFKPDVAVGFGSYVTVPVLMAACRRKVRTAIHEQNSVAGMANKALAHYVDKIITVYPSANEAFPARKVVTLGNPRESAVLEFAPDPAVISGFGLDPERKTVLIVMGSLGSSSVNEKMVGVLETLAGRSYNVIYVTGRRDYEDFIRQVTPADNIRVVDYIDQFTVAGNCQLVVSRGGATSACEYMALGLPSIIIPSPYVPNNHQFLNAEAMLKNGASLLLEEKDLTAERLSGMIDEVLTDETKRQAMASAAKAMSHPDAARQISRLLTELAGKRS
jgi:UDP-N-acetylglucosamine--N-acetylmuramyl-(pentapeptide) pyrophosphoryl-undecaprenol N-acetylglucosamine transferase